jgi:hypothetical protein
MKCISIICIIAFLGSGTLFSPIKAQFIDHFEDPFDPYNPEIPDGWGCASGDGEVKIDFLQKTGYATIYVDAKEDKRNIWWAIIRREVPGLNMEELIQPDKELRAEARIRVSHAPRRVNLHFNHQRTTDFHSHLMEFDIPDTVNWHTISMTTQEFEIQPGDRINVQMALMDWGLGEYRVDVDYLRVDVVDEEAIKNDLGAKIPYHPPVAVPSSFDQHIPVLQDGMIDIEFPALNFNDWKTGDQNEEIILLTVSGTQFVILRWDLSPYQGKKVSGSGLLELTTHSLQRSPQYQKDFGMVRVTEILGGDPAWDQEKVTFVSFSQGNPLEEVLNPQMVIDWEVNSDQGGKTRFTISQPVLQRMIDGRTPGLAIRPLGAVMGSLYASEYRQGIFSATLHFNLE